MITTEARPISDLYEGMSPERLQRIDKKSRLLKMGLNLIEKLGRELTDEEVAVIEDIEDQALQNINQDDIFLRTLEQYVKALGGKLEIKFPDQVFSLGVLEQPAVTSIPQKETTSM